MSRASVRIHIVRQALIVAAGILAVVCLTDPQRSFAQSTTSAAKFEVVSIRLSPRRVDGPLNIIDFNFLRSMAQGSRGGRFTLDGASLKFLIELAYDVKDSQVLGRPSWADSDRFDVALKPREMPPLSRCGTCCNRCWPTGSSLRFATRQGNSPFMNWRRPRAGSRSSRRTRGTALCLTRMAPVSRSIQVVLLRSIFVGVSRDE